MHTKILVLQNLYNIKLSMNRFMNHVFMNISEKIKQKLAFTLEEDEIDILNLKQDVEFICGKAKGHMQKAKVKKFITADGLLNPIKLDFFSDQVMFALLFVEEKVSTVGLFTALLAVYWRFLLLWNLLG